MSAWDMIVVGGGAAGFFAAVNAAELRPGLRVLIIEKSTQVLGKVRISGGGRCNVTHACFDPAQLVQFYPRGGKALRGAFARFQPRDTVAWFEARGVRLKTEPDGRMFPVTDSSETIVNCLVAAAQRAGVQVRLRVSVKNLTVEEDGFGVELSTGEHLQAAAVLLATGGDRTALGMSARLGHTVTEPVPSLFTFAIPDPRLDDLAGISVPDAVLRLPDQKLEARGPLLITHWGLSGPAVLRLSAWGARALFAAQYHARLTVNWLGDVNGEQAAAWLREARGRLTRQKCITNPPDSRLPQRLWTRLALAAGVGDALNWADVSNAALGRLAGELTRGEY
ncbi:MAG: aminoacetone oxidase family FAD-binding enzyme, partial [Anaerolineales bacterium]